MTAGDVVKIVARRTSGNLQPSVAFFDAEGELINEDTLTAVEIREPIRALSIRSERASIVFTRQLLTRLRTQQR